MPVVRQLGDRYEVGELLGRGGMAEVFVGTDLRLGRRVAIKILKSDLAADPTFLARFRREARSAASLNHPHIVAVYDTGEEILGEGSRAITVPFIVMELVEGVTLKELLQGDSPLVPERALEITSGILAALDYSHRHGIIHRDIKPGNVMVTAAGVIKVMDFGIARATADAGVTGTSASTVMGTAAYLSPEQAQGRTVDARSDLYSTGVVLFELLTRRAPFIAEAPVAVAFAHVNEEAPVPSSIDPTISPSLDALVAKALAKDPGARFQSAVEFRAEVERAMAGVPLTQVIAPAIIPDSQATAVLGAADPYATAVMGTAATGALPPVVAAGAGAAAMPPSGGAPPPEKKNGLRSAGLIALLIALVGGGIWLATNLLQPGSKAVEVPSLDGMTVAEADSELRSVGLGLGRQEVETSDLPPDTIIGQDPRSGELVNSGTKVDVKISAGKEQVTVPDLVDYASADDARTALMGVGLALGKVVPEDSEKPEGTVLRQDPAPFETVDAGTAVDIWVSTELIAVPNVVGDTESQARTKLFNEGFDVDSSATQESTRPAGSVLEQSPTAGTKAKKGSTIRLTIAVEPAPEPEPSTPAPSTPTVPDESGFTPSDNPLEGTSDDDDDPGPLAAPTP